jgi:hypothetical protein
VVEEGIDLGDEPLVTPKEVDLPAAELDVDLGRRDAVAAVEVEEGGLEVTTRAIALDAVEAVALVLGLTDRAAEEVRWEQV